MFKNIDVLHPFYTPERLPFREEESRRIANYLSYLKLGSAVPTLILYGKTGTGKTASFIHAMEHDLPKKNLRVEVSPFKDHYKIKIGHWELDAIYINAAHFRGEILIIGEIVAKAIKPGFRWRGHSKDEIYTVFRQRKSPIVVAIDEVDKLPLAERDAVIYTLSRESKPTVVGMVLISNRPEVIEEIEHRTLSGIQTRTIEFTIYSAEQLKTIASQRVQLAFAPGSVGAATISLAAHFAYQRGGDARKVIDYLRRAGEIADEEGSKKVTVEHVRKAVSSADLDEVADLVKDRVPQEKLLLYALVNLHDLKAKRKIPRYTTVMLYAIYKEFAKELAYPVFGKPAILRFVRAFELEDLVTSHRRGRGRGKGLDKFLDIDAAKAASLREKLEEDLDIKMLIDSYDSRESFDAAILKLAKKTLIL